MIGKDFINPLRPPKRNNYDNNSINSNNNDEDDDNNGIDVDGDDDDDDDQPKLKILKSIRAQRITVLLH